MGLINRKNLKNIEDNNIELQYTKDKILDITNHAIILQEKEKWNAFCILGFNHKIELYRKELPLDSKENSKRFKREVNKAIKEALKML